MTGRRSWTGALTVAVLLVLAGCGGSAGDASRSATLTPAPVPQGDRAAANASGAAAERVVSGRRLAPGLRTGGVADPFALARAHHRALVTRSFTRVDSRTVVDANGTLRSTRTELSVAPGRVPFRLHRSSVSAPRYDVQSPFDGLTVYYDGEAAYYRLVRAANVTYGADSGTTGVAVLSDRTGHDAVLGLLTAFRWEVESFAVGGERRYELESRALVAPDALDDASLLTDPREAEVSILVGPGGRVHRFRLEYTTTYDGRRVGVTETMRWSSVNETTVSTPDWLGRARNGSDDRAREGRAGTVAEVLDG